MRPQRSWRMRAAVADIGGSQPGNGILKLMMFASFAGVCCLQRMDKTGNPTARRQRTLGSFIFLSRWLQAPLYFGLIVAQAVYVCHFLVELWHLIAVATTITETEIMLTVLGLIDVVISSQNRKLTGSSI